MTGSASALTDLFDGLHQLNLVQVRQALAQSVDLTAHNQQGQGVFSALFHCIGSDELDISETKAMTLLDQIEQLLLEHGAPVAHVTYLDKPLFAGVLDTSFFSISHGCDEALMMQRMRRWLQHPEVKGAGATWGAECADVWMNHMTQEYEEATRFGLMVLPELLNEGMEPSLIDTLGSDIEGHDAAMAITTAARRAKQGRAGPTASRRRRST